MIKYHKPVMVKEVLTNLLVKKSGKYIDATLGTGGHALAILKAGGEILGIEADPKMLAIAQRRLGVVSVPPSRWKLVLGNFARIDEIARDNGFVRVSGILFDLGVSNIHLTEDSRGFSFGDPDAKLDMRLNPEAQGVTGADLLNVLRKDQLEALFRATLDSGSAKWLTQRVLAARPVTTVGNFLDICHGLRVKPSLSEATLPFLALRIAVNSELRNLEAALPKAYGLLEKGGRMVVISFHSGEDKIVKNFGKNKLILPNEKEVAQNPRARSAKMRVFTK